MHILMLSIFFCLMSLNAAYQPQKCVESEVQTEDDMKQNYALKILMESGIDYANLCVLDLGCGDGSFARAIAEKAHSVCGVDINQEIIELANEQHSGMQNLSFIRASAEYYQRKESFNLITSFFCLHWIDDLKSTLESIYKSLQLEGIFLGTIITTIDEDPLVLQAFKKTIPWLKQAFPCMPEINITNATGCFIRDKDELIRLIKAIGFEVVTLEHKNITMTFENKDQLINSLYSMAMSIPIAKDMSEIHKETFLNKLLVEFINLLCGKEGRYSCTDSITILYLRKK